MNQGRFWSLTGLLLLAVDAGAQPAGTVASAPEGAGIQKAETQPDSTRPWPEPVRPAHGTTAPEAAGLPADALFVGPPETAAEPDQAILPAGAVQPTRQALLAERGAAFRYHYHAIQSWEVSAEGTVRNVYA